MSLKEYTLGTTFPGRTLRRRWRSASGPADRGAQSRLVGAPALRAALPFTGRIVKVVADVSGQMIRDTEQEARAFARAAMARQ